MKVLFNAQLSMAMALRNLPMGTFTKDNTIREDLMVKGNISGQMVHHIKVIS